jgi:hypothetical protein
VVPSRRGGTARTLRRVIICTPTHTSEGRFLVTITATDTEATPQSYSVSFIIDPIVRIS